MCRKAPCISENWRQLRVMTFFCRFIVSGTIILLDTENLPFSALTKKSKSLSYCEAHHKFRLTTDKLRFVWSQNWHTKKLVYFRLWKQGNILMNIDLFWVIKRYEVVHVCRFCAKHVLSCTICRSLISRSNYCLDTELIALSYWTKKKS